MWRHLSNQSRSRSHVTSPLKPITIPLTCDVSSQTNHDPAHINVTSPLKPITIPLTCDVSSQTNPDPAYINVTFCTAPNALIEGKWALVEVTRTRIKWMHKYFEIVRVWSKFYRIYVNIQLLEADMSDFNYSIFTVWAVLDYKNVQVSLRNSSKQIISWILNFNIAVFFLWN